MKMLRPIVLHASEAHFSFYSPDKSLQLVLKSKPSKNKNKNIDHMSAFWARPWFSGFTNLGVKAS